MTGAPPEVLEAARAKMKPAIEEGFDVWPENWAAFNFFKGLRSQWIVVAGMGNAIKCGLDYCRVEAKMNILGIPRKKRPELFHDLQIMEHAALDAWAK